MEKSIDPYDFYLSQKRLLERDRAAVEALERSGNYAFANSMRLLIAPLGMDLLRMESSEYIQRRIREDTLKEIVLSLGRRF